ncbi:MAG: hypothetical protein Q7T57_04230, partial [Dehalococcoidales bacterium]|nr:hypothetical protein [Dehalococcoidales bacterium]
VRPGGGGKVEVDGQAEERKEAPPAKPSLAPGRVRSPTPERKAPERSAEGRSDVGRAAKFDHRTENILKHREGVSGENTREGLRTRKPDSQLLHSLYGKINWS